MKLSKTAQELYQAITKLPVVDAHEHLPPEKEYIRAEYSGLNLFAGGYIWNDLESAGLSPEFKATMRNGGARSVDEWWPVIKPCWEQVRHTSYARALRITARDIFNLPDIDDTTITDLADAVKESNRPGLYRRILQERCGIRVSITCIDQPEFPDDPGLKGITQLEKNTGTPSEIAQALSVRAGCDVRNLEDAINAGQAVLRDDLKRGALGFKTTVAAHGLPSLESAANEWKEGKRNVESYAVQDLLFDKYLDIAAEANVPVAVHTGYWGDFRKLDPKHILSFAMRRQDVRFDMFHLGMPMIRDAIMIGKTLPNVTLNLTWCPIISQVQTVRALDEMIDMVPLNKIIAFGGDYRVAVQKVYGHLTMAREAVAAALARRVEARDFDVAEALRIAKMWFYDNPVRIYGLEDSI